jgi:hypothetical protein
MSRQGHLKLRLTVDIVLLCVLGLIAPIALSPVGRSWGVLLIYFLMFLICVGFLYDGLRTMERLRKPDSN